MMAPFIFEFFNQTAADVDVLTHEAGHAFEAYTATRNGVPDEIAFQLRRLRRFIPCLWNI